MNIRLVNAESISPEKFLTTGLSQLFEGAVKASSDGKLSDTTLYSAGIVWITPSIR